ncbi:MAG: hypothetical protein V1837_00995 [Candidatus Woesearchaeota archaeon]
MAYYMPAQIDVAGAFSYVGEWINQIFSNEYATFGVTIIVLTILLKSIFAASLRKTKLFEGAGGTGTSGPGNAIAWSFAMLSSIGLYYLKGDRNVGVFLRNILGPAGIWAAIVATIFLFLWLKGATGSTKWALPLTGLAAIAISNMVQWPMLASGGVFMMIGGVFWLIGSSARGPRPISRRDVNRTQNADNSLSNTTNNLFRTLQRDNQVNSPVGRTAVNAANAETQETMQEEQNQADENRRVNNAIAAAASDNPEALAVLHREREGLFRDWTQDLAQIEQTNAQVDEDRKNLEACRQAIGQQLSQLAKAEELSKKVEGKLQSTNPEELKRINRNYPADVKLHLDLLKKVFDKLREYQQLETRIGDIEAELESKDNQISQIIGTALTQLHEDYFTNKQGSIDALKVVRDLEHKKNILLTNKESLIRELKRSIFHAANLSREVQGMQQSISRLEHGLRMEEADMKLKAAEEEALVANEKQRIQEVETRKRGFNI